MLTLPRPDELAKFVPNQNLSDVLLQLMWLMRDIATLTRAKAIDEADLARFEQKTRRVFMLWKTLEHLDKTQHITPKLHLLCAHMSPFARYFFSLPNASMLWVVLFVDCMAGSVQYRNREWNTSTQNSIEWRSA
jgi:hypothetical protein